MSNPWVDLPLVPPYILAGDERHVLEFNAKVPPQLAVHLELIPEPFLGSPDAPVVLLNLNPGFDPRETRLHTHDTVFVELSRRNLLHEPLGYPFYLLDPRISASLGHQWWMRKLAAPIQAAGAAAVARRFLCIEYFPYHSTRYRALPTELDSQQYNFALARQAIARGSLIVIMRGKTNWTRAVPELSSYKYVYELKSPQNVTISPGNCPDGYPHIIRILES